MIRNLNRPIGRAGIHHDDFAAAALHQRPNAFQRPLNIFFFVVGDDDDREFHRESIPEELEISNCSGNRAFPIIR